jgi:uncharacterized protein (TIGR00725 family)
MDRISSPVIGVIGGKAADPGQLSDAEEAGRLIARAGAVLATGGMGGVMEAASRGAHAEGGIVLGILPGEDKSAANDYVDVAVATGFGIGRNIVLVRTADALLAVGGQYGTLSEIAYALQMGKPVVGIGTWEIDGVMPAPNARKAMDIIFEALGKRK